MELAADNLPISTCLAGDGSDILVARTLDARNSDSTIALLLPQPYSGTALMELAERNPQYQIEQSSEGHLTLSPPTAASGNEGELELAMQVFAWNRRTHFGKVGGLTAGIRLTEGGDYIPDVYVVAQDVWDTVPADKRETAGYVPVLPIAVFELLSPGNKTATGFTQAFKEKLDDFERSAVRLVVLLDPASRTTAIRRLRREAETTTEPILIFDELPGLQLNVAEVFLAIK